MKKFIFISFLSMIMLFAVNSMAVDMTMFGPGRYVRTAGEPDEFADTFIALPKEGKMVIKNGDEDEKHRVTSALITLNGEELLSPDDFKPQIYYRELTVKLKDSNSLYVELRGKPGTYLLIEVIQDDLPPSITILEPDGVDDSADSGFTIGWTDDDPDDNAVISFYYDPDNTGSDGTLIMSGISEDPDGQYDQYVWETGDISDGEYYIYAVIDDGVNEPVIDYSEGRVTISHNVFNEAKLLASDGSLMDSFGISVSIDGDYAVVGAPYDDDKGNDSGSVYVFKRGQGNEWHEAAKITASDGASYDHFGFSVSISGAYIIVGALYDDDKGTDSGSAYIYRRDGEEWNEVAKLVASDGSSGDNFGRSVSICGDYAIVGAPDDDYSGMLSTGSVYFFKRDIINWNEIVKRRARYGEAGDWFGQSVSIGNGYAIIGAPGDNYYEVNSGAVYLFRLQNNTWAQACKQKASDSGYNFFYGRSVSICGSYAIVGSDRDDDNGAGSGSAYVYRVYSNSLSERAKLIASDGKEGDSFGFTVSVNDDYAVVSARYHAGVGRDSGSIYIFNNRDGIWGEMVEIRPSDAMEYDNFGRSVCINGDYAIVGSTGDDDKGDESGSAYIYKIANNEDFPVLTIHADPEIIQAGGHSVLTWSSENADTCVIEPGIGSVALNGSITVSPDKTTTYIITATGAAGSVTASVTVTVQHPLPLATLDADPEVVMSGSSSVLTWSSTNAESCVILPGIGEVGLSGNLTVTPAVTTTYTITANGPGGTVTENATITVTFPEPAVSMSAAPDTIQIGGLSTLTWSSSNAVSCFVEPGIGNVDAQGSISVSPEETTVYSIAATGPGGTATDSATVTVTYPQPEVSISADPGFINIGDYSTIIWTSSYASNVYIDQGVGGVEKNGSVTVSPIETTTYTITASNPAGSVSESIKITVIPLGITITSPLNDDLISMPDVMVQGIINNPSGQEVGVNVNGVVALVHGNQFVANHVPLEEGENTITATATGAEGNTAGDNIEVYADATADYIRITIDEESGIAPFETQVEIDASFSLTEEPEITYAGPGDVDIVRLEDGYKYSVTAHVPGLYYIKAKVIHEGDTYYDTIAMIVMDESALDTLLRAKWNGMKTALVDGKIQDSLDFLHETAHEKYVAIYTFLGNDIQNKAGQMQEIEPVLMEGGRAKYRINREHNVNGQSVTITYYIYFIKDEYGLWKIEGY